jgi:hypothetical protein
MAYDEECETFRFTPRNVAFAVPAFWRLRGSSMRKGAFPPALHRDRPERGVGPASPDALSRFVIAREKLRERAPKVMKSLKRVNLCEGASALVPAATSQALRANFHFSG